MSASLEKLPRRRILPGILCMLLAGCAAPPIFPPIDPPIYWPQTDDPPRISYVGSIEGEENLKKPPSLWAWLGNLFGGSEPPARIQKPMGVAVTPEGLLYVTDPDARAVHLLDLERREYRSLRDAGNGRQFLAPLGIAVGKGEIVVSDRALRTVTVLSLQGEPLSVLGAGVLTGPVGVAVGSLTGRIFVADVDTHQILAFHRDGGVALTLGGRGVDPEKFNFPTHIACDGEENLYVSDALNARIQVFDREGRFLRSWGKRGDRPGNFSQPKGIACGPEGTIYVVDSHFENVQVFNSRGEFLLPLGEEGHGPGQFWLPVGIFVGGDDLIWVADSFNHRVQVFRRLSEIDVQGVP